MDFILSVQIFRNISSLRNDDDGGGGIYTGGDQKPQILKLVLSFG